MSTFKFLNDTPINGTTFTEWHEWLYQNRYRWAVIGYEMIGVTPLYPEAIKASFIDMTDEVESLVSFNWNGYKLLALK